MGYKGWGGAGMEIQWPNRRQLAIVVGVVVAVAVAGLIAWGFAQQVALARQLKAEEARLEEAVATAQVRHGELVELSEYVQTDPYVEEWARGKVKMTKRGEVLTIPPAVDEPAESVEEAPPPAEPEDRPFWAEWWASIFGSD